ncbi:FAD/NAD(P)-binding domain-containing protein [Paraphaeosphaeria sporulosa]|uniref:FAD/NAD(P)-binding domain-containing protein n=1 Tax=Paraphaeosphaeria sporulosa TaxID=1460663 RepID=A0A177C6Z1_9PLEO|nr:FAD/NAD(P)-binding domain-containing protein [Paraphaeosphaeria sporulosa]OAG03305.1 FAD/NAD(P)-binding domain-containing protein [Paraphaeosphaeria sporulosa]
MPPDLHVAIVGGGLGGIALAIALKARNISFTIYEAKSAFTEIGAGINLAPNGLHALREIDASLGDRIYALATRNLPPSEDTWMWVRYGAGHRDGETVVELRAPPTGCMAMHRQELLGVLAEKMGYEHAQFNKKLVSFEQDDDAVRLRFEDDTVESASVLVGCDGIHSRVRACMFGSDSAIARPHFNSDGAYRAVIPIADAKKVFGETARQSQVLLGPNGYVIYYPVNNGTAVNVGIWVRRAGHVWDRKDWVVPRQGAQFRRDLEGWGPRVRALMPFFGAEPAFWAAHQHRVQPASFVQGRVVLMGDGAHAMPPHIGGGASQAAEDAYVLAELLASIPPKDASLAAVRAALRAAESVRMPRFLAVQDISVRAGPDWYSFFERGLEGEQLEGWSVGIKTSVEWVWNVDLRDEVSKAKQTLADSCDARSR